MQCEAISNCGNCLGATTCKWVVFDETSVCLLLDREVTASATVLSPGWGHEYPSNLVSSLFGFDSPILWFLVAVVKLALGWTTLTGIARKYVNWALKAFREFNPNAPLPGIEFLRTLKAIMPPLRQEDFSSASSSSSSSEGEEEEVVILPSVSFPLPPIPASPTFALSSSCQLRNLFVSGGRRISLAVSGFSLNLGWVHAPKSSSRKTMWPFSSPTSSFGQRSGPCLTMLLISMLSFSHRVRKWIRKRNNSFNPSLPPLRRSGRSNNVTPMSLDHLLLDPSNENPLLNPPPNKFLPQPTFQPSFLTSATL